MSRNLQQAAAAEARNAGVRCVQSHPVLASLATSAHFYIDTNHRFVSAKGWLAVTPDGCIWLHPKRRADPQAWSRMLAIALTCLGFGLVREQEPYDLWEIASVLIADRFCDELKIGQLPEDLRPPELHYPAGGAESLLRQFCVAGIEPAMRTWYQDLCAEATMFCGLDEKEMSRQRRPKWRDLLGDGIARGVGRALQIVSGATTSDGAIKPLTKALRAKRRLIDHYPLLGALAASFDIEEDRCQRFK